MMRRLFSFHGGIHPPQHKQESTRGPIRTLPLAPQLVLPLHQHIGESAEPVVTVGEHVGKGQKIARAREYVSAPVHASSSGTVVAIEERPIPHPSGLNAPCIVIETDGRDEWIEHGREDDYHRMEPSHLRNLVRSAGIVGLGGAGFPTFIKLNPTAGKVIDTLILNGVECEPYITCDDMLMRERAADIVAGIHIMRHALQARACVIAIEDNKPEAYASMQQAVQDTDIEVVQIPTLYPSGSEKQLIKIITGKEVPSNGLPFQIAVVVHNVGTAAAVHRALNLGEPLVSRIVTVTGDGVADAANFEVPFGTPVEHLLRHSGARLESLTHLVMGGPLMGFALHATEVPVIKTTNCILASRQLGAHGQQSIMPCIRCGACVDVCPVNLLPQQLYWHARANELDRVQEYNLFDCIECGCCAYVCPSNIPLVHYYRYAKTEIWAKEREKEKADQSRHRHEFRLERLEREKSERAAKLAQKQAAVEKQDQETGASDDKKAAIEAALARVKAKKDQAATEAAIPTESDQSKT